MPPKKEPEENSAPRQRPATTPYDREQQMIALADKVAEQQMRDGTISAQVLTLYLKAGTERDRLEREKIQHENLRLEAQVAEIKSRASTEELMNRVLNNMKVYMGVDDDEDL